MICFFPLPAVGDTTTLDDFVYAIDPTYGYSVYSTTIFLTHTRYCLSMISGQWRDATEVNRTQWEHWVTLYVPHFLLHDTALLHIDGGSNGSPPDFTSLDEFAAPIAVLTGSVVVNLGQVPNQPLTFAGETQSRTEDALIAYSWKKFLEEPADVTWPAQLPMTRAAVRAMDAVQSFMSVVRPSNSIDHFVVAGASKRGWTTWLTAAAENGPLGGQHVSAIVPIVIDVLNMEKSLEHHYKVYGFWAPAVHDYVDAGIMDYIGTPEISALADIVDPYVYLDRLTMPKFIYNSTGDQFFVTDSWKFYYDDLSEPKRLRYFPNTDHSMSQLSDGFLEIFGIYATFLSNGVAGIPQYSWEIIDNETIRLQTSEPGVTVKLWQAVNSQARDFRYEVIGAGYLETILSDQGGGIYTGGVNVPEEGWKAFLIEVSFSGNLAFTSGVNVITEPDTVMLRIEKTGSDIALSFNSSTGTFYNVYSSPELSSWNLLDSVIPVADTTTWVDPSPADDKKFYIVEQVIP